MSPRGYAARPYDEWSPDEQDTTVVTAAEIVPGTVVAWNYKPLLIVRTEEINLANWKTSFVQAWQAAGEPDHETWNGRPLYIHNRTDRTKDPLKVGTAPASWKYLVLPKHYAVCSHCGDLPPCREVFMDRVMAIEGKRIDFEMRLVHGACHGCGQAVTPREHSMLFPGDNLIRPDLGSNTAVFHTRHSCLPLALAYQERWLAADDSRTPRLGDGARQPRKRDQMT
ncbi:hypothetical protein [Streptomyces olivochromogenes]|jgi:hypothetical protein|uniref:Uncharacterized protein n=1 Tax=Streptomyces olivochromogenes TaxID=1963 RepID=A0A286PHH4_STROL|nr:hypothetical protein [Streptomyces olivochromogenes]KUN38196.1 hypothetical protein AQJ27_44645 [Streptomyces olivochromogenes]GAX59003.1 hypothetical protein SO3561_10578 [Streptomyces olivochromogenes]